MYVCVCVCACLAFQIFSLSFLRNLNFSSAQSRFVQHLRLAPLISSMQLYRYTQRKRSPGDHFFIYQYSGEQLPLFPLSKLLECSEQFSITYDSNRRSLARISKTSRFYHTSSVWLQQLRRAYNLVPVPKVALHIPSATLGVFVRFVNLFLVCPEEFWLARVSKRGFSSYFGSGIH